MGPRVIVVLFAAMTACGPIVYVNEVTRRASDAVETARQAQADKYAPYWWTRATQYLHQARVKAARADFQGANRFGRLASEAADKAAEEAAVAARDPSKRPFEVDLAPGGGGTSPDGALAPAKEAP
jgi:hypothetical protein